MGEWGKRGRKLREGECQKEIDSLLRSYKPRCASLYLENQSRNSPGADKGMPRTNHYIAEDLVNHLRGPLGKPVTVTSILWIKNLRLNEGNLALPLAGKF